MENIKRVFKRLIRDFQDRELSLIYPREVNLPQEPERIVTVTGARRTGKTWLIFKTIELLTEGDDFYESRIVYINLEDDRLFPLTLDDLGKLPDAYYELFRENKEVNVYFFLEEVQIVDGWEKFVRRLWDTEKCYVYLTGSSSKLLSREIATSLRGRTINYEAFPYSFSEFLNVKGIDVDIYSSKSAALIKKALENYLTNGAFPEIVNAASSEREKIRQQYIDLILYRDVIERHNISNSYLLKYYLQFLLKNSTNLMSINKIYRDFRSQGLSVSKNSLYEYLEYLKDAYALFTVPLFTENLRTQQRNPRKVYPLDISLKNAMSIREERGKEFEIAVFLELRRRYDQIYYWKGKQEVDFCVTTKEGLMLINVCSDLTDKRTRKRELAGLVEAAKNFSVTEILLLSSDREETISHNNIKIEIMPLWKWLAVETKV